MAQPYGITAGEVQVSSTGPVTGTLSTNGLTKAGRIWVRIRGLQPGQSMRVAIEDTANATPFSDATTCWSYDTAQDSQIPAIPANQVEASVGAGRLLDMRFGGTLNLLRANVTSITASTTAFVEAWLEQ